jgi:hypothetical protein
MVATFTVISDADVSDLHWQEPAVADQCGEQQYPS